MKRANIFYCDGELCVRLEKDGKTFGYLAMFDHNYEYAHDACINWEDGILAEDNPHIQRELPRGIHD